MMIRVLTILAAVVALAVSAAPASAGKSEHGTATYGDPQAQTYLELNLETTIITSYELGWEYWNPFGL